MTTKTPTFMLLDCPTEEACNDLLGLLAVLGHTGIIWSTADGESAVLFVDAQTDDDTQSLWDAAGLDRAVYPELVGEA